MIHRLTPCQIQQRLAPPSSRPTLGIRSPRAVIPRLDLGMAQRSDPPAKWQAATRCATLARRSQGLFRGSEYMAGRDRYGPRVSQRCCHRPKPHLPPDVSKSNRAIRCRKQRKPYRGPSAAETPRKNRRRLRTACDPLRAARPGTKQACGHQPQANDTLKTMS
jgi:hypothetical protein